MNGELTPTRRSRRLYCARLVRMRCIKWVNEIGPVSDLAEPTSQMQEYATRTHQRGMPERASDYQPASIDPAAMPIRVEQCWSTPDPFKVIESCGADRSSRRTSKIRFRLMAYLPVSRILRREHPGTWTHVWDARQPATSTGSAPPRQTSIRTRP